MAKSWAPELTDGSGWSKNGYRYATQAEALSDADATFMRWLGAKDKRAVETRDPVNARWDAETGKAVRL